MRVDLTCPSGENYSINWSGWQPVDTAVLTFIRVRTAVSTGCHPDQLIE